MLVDVSVVGPGSCVWINSSVMAGLPGGVMVCIFLVGAGEIEIGEVEFEPA